MNKSKNPDGRLEASLSLLSQMTTISKATKSGDKTKKASNPKTSKPRPQREKEPLQRARTFAWLSAVKRALAEKEGNPPTIAYLKSEHGWKTAKDAIQQDINFDRFEKGTSVPSPETLELIDTCLRYEIKPPCADVFRVGPGNMPLWGLLDGSLPDKDCTALLDAFYIYAIRQIGIDAGDKEKEKIASVYCARKIDALFDYFCGEDGTKKISFSGYDSQNVDFRDNQIFKRMVAREKYPGVEEFVFLLAAAHLAESRKECRSLGRYLLDAAILCAQKTFADYDCGELVVELLAGRRKFTDSATIAQAEFIREMKGSELSPEEQKNLVALTDRLERTPAFEHPDRQFAIDAIGTLYKGIKAFERL